MCRVQYSNPYLKGQGHTTILKFTLSQLEFISTHICVRAVTCHASKDFKITRHKCLQHQDDVLRQRPMSLPLRSHL
jgi:hypothetical protein